MKFPGFLPATLAVSMLTVSGCNHHDAKARTDGIKCNSIEEFVDYWSRAYDKGDNDALASTFFTKGIPQKCINEFEALFGTYSGKHEVTHSNIEPFDGEVKPYNWNGEMVLSKIRPGWIVTIETKGNEGFEGSESTLTVRFTVGKTSDGKFGIPIGDYGI